MGQWRGPLTGEKQWTPPGTGNRASFDSIIAPKLEKPSMS